MSVHITRRCFLQYGAMGGAALYLPWALEAKAAKPLRLTKYLEPVPLPGAGIVVATPSGPNQYSFTQTEISRQLHPQLPPTPLWAYDDGSGLGGSGRLVRDGGRRAERHAAHGQLHARPPDDLPGLAPGRHAADAARQRGALMTHLHGGFVAADSDGNPAVTPNGFGPGETQTRLLHEPDTADAGLAAVVPRPRPRRHPAERLRRARCRLHPARRVRHRRRAEPDRDPRRGLRDPAGHPGSPVQPGRDVPVSRPATSPAPPGSASTSATSMLVNGKVWPFLDVEPRMYRFRILNGCNARILSLDIGGASVLADRRRGRHVGHAGAGEAAGAGPGRAGRRARRLQQVRRPDADDEEPQAAEAGRRRRRPRSSR